MPTVSLKDSSFKAELPPEETVYDGLDRNGHQLPHGCLAGSCGSCCVEVWAGEEFLHPPGDVEKSTLANIREGYEGKAVLRLSCRAKTKGEGKIVISPLRS